MNLYRFINEEKLHNLFDTSSFELKLPLKWKDKWEGFPFELLDNEKGRLKVKQYLEKNNIPFHQDIITILKEAIYCLCFTKTDESEALWNAYYNHNSVVRIEIEKKNFISEFDSGNHSELTDVTYVKDSITESFLLKILSNIIISTETGAKTFPMKGYTFKREKEYFWENECRFLFYETKNLTLERPDSGQQIFCTQANMNIGGNSVPDKKVITMSCPLNEMIKSVLVHPDADRSFCENIEKMCKSVGVYYLGKSTMNSPPQLY